MKITSLKRLFLTTALILNFSVVLANAADIFPITFTDSTSVESFLNTNKEQLEISDSVLNENTEKLGLAYSTKTISDENEFWGIYADYENQAQQYVLSQLNKADSAEVFNNIINQYSNILGLDLTEYNKLADKSVFMDLLKNTAFTAEAFKVNFDNAVSECAGKLVNVQANAVDACMISSSNKDWNNNKDESGHYDTAMRQLMTKYDLSGINTANVKSAKLKLYCSQNGTGNDTTTFAFAMMPSNDWDGATLTWNKYVEIGGGWFGEGKGVKWVNNVYSPTDSYAEIDVLEYITSGMKEISFMAFVNSNSYKFANPLSAEKPAYIDIEYLAASSGVKELTYSISSGSENVSIDTNKLTVTAQTAFNSETVTSDNITVSKNGKALEASEYAVAPSNGGIAIIFNNPLDENSIYSVTPSGNLAFEADSNRYMFNPMAFKTEKTSFDLSDIKFINQGSVYDSVSDCMGKNVKSVVTLDNSSDSAQNCIVIASLYEEKDGYVRMISSKLSQCALDEDKKAVYVSNFNVPSDSEYFVTYNIWDGLSTMNKIIHKRK